MSRDLQSTMGQNLNLVKKCSKLDPLLFGAYRIKERLKENEMVEIDRRDLWRIPYLRSLLGQHWDAACSADGVNTMYPRSLINNLVM